VAVITSGHRALQYRIRAPAVAEAAAQLRRPRSSLQARRSAWGTSGSCQEGRPPQPGSVPHPPHSQPHHQRRKKQVGPARRECLHATGSGAGGHHDHSRIIATAGRGRAGCHLDRALQLRPSRRGLPRSQRPAWGSSHRPHLLDYKMLAKPRFLISPVRRAGPGLWRVTAAPRIADAVARGPGMTSAIFNDWPEGWSRQK
jgi:hypothetical protein